MFETAFLISALVILTPADPARFPEIWQDGVFNLEAHRGLSDLCPENTFLSFKAAAEQGRNIYRGMETDVQMTSDGRLVCMHDETLDRTTNATGKVPDYDFATLRTFDAGRGEKIPTIEEYLECCRKGGFIPYIELKGDIGVEGQRKLVNTVHSCGYSDGQYVLTSFHREYLETASLLCDTPMEYMQSRLPSAEDFDKLGSIRNLVIRPSAKSLTEEFVQECRRRGVPLECYGLPVFDKTLYANLKAWGVRGCTCNSYAVTRERPIEKYSPSDTLRILGVGNSWTRDAIRYLCAIARSAGRPLIVGHAYLGGSTLAQQLRGIDDPSYTYTHAGKQQVVHDTYQYWKYVCADDPVKTPSKGYKNGLGGIGVTLGSVVGDEPWDIVILQPNVKDAAQNLKPLKKRLIKMMDKNVAREVRWGIMLPQKYADGTIGRDVIPLEDLHRDVLKAARSFDASFFVNVGEAIESARAIPCLDASGYHLQRAQNNTHLSAGIAQYVASLAYAKALLDIRAEDIKFCPDRTAATASEIDKSAKADNSSAIKSVSVTPDQKREAVRAVFSKK